MRRPILLAAVAMLSAPVQAVPDIEHWMSAHNTPVYFIAAPQISMLDIRVLLDAGTSRDGDLPGLSLMTHALLDSGTVNHPVDAIAEQFDAVGAHYSAKAQRDRSSVSLRTLSDRAFREPALTTLQTVLEQPAFPAEQFERRRQQMQVGLKKLNEDPGAVAERAFYRALYPNHPYGLPAAGTETSLAAITRDDVERFYQTHFTATGAVIVMVGAIDRATAEAIADRLSGALPSGPKPPALAEPEPITEARTIRIEFPSQQAHVLIGAQGVARGDKDHFPLYLGNHVLGGGGFSSRLLKEIRSKMGLAYSVYSYFFPMRHRGPFRLGLQTQGAQTQVALESSLQMLTDYIDQGPNAEELEHSRANIVLGFPLRIAENRSMLDYLAMIGYYRLPLDYLQTWRAQINAVSQDQVVDAFQRRLDPERLITVIVGGQNPS